MFKNVLLLFFLVLVASTQASTANFQYWTRPKIEGARFEITDEGYYNLGRTRPLSYKWATTNRNCAILLCIGSRLVKVHVRSIRNEDADISPSEPFNNVVIMCGRNWRCPQGGQRQID